MPSASRSDFLASEHGASADVVIAGAGVMGASLAYWLSHLDPALRVILIERDTRFERASSSLSASSIRQQFTTPVNIALSAFGIRFLREASLTLSTDEHPVELGLREPGYLYLAGEKEESALREAHRIQLACGAKVALLEPRALAERFGWLNVNDLALGSLGLSGEGWFDGPALHRALLRKARAQGTQLVAGEVVGLDFGMQRSSEDWPAASVLLADGTRIACGHFVNAAGPWSGSLAHKLGIDLPVRARRRTVFVLSSPAALPGCPLIIDPSGFWLRPEGDRWLFGSPPIDDSDDLPLEPDWREFDDAAWARLAHRIPALEAARVEHAWSGYYEINTLDHNAVLGPHPEHRNLWFMSGFSGHGMQHAPGAGLALAQWILGGEPLAINIRPLGFDRILSGKPLLELNVIG